MSQVVHGQDGAGVLIHPMRPVLGSQVDRDQCAMPIICHEDTVVSKESPLQLEDEGSLQRSHIEQGKAELQY